MQQKGKKSSSVDKLIKGIIIGGAIGSVVGITLAPKSGKETRKELQGKVSSIFTRKPKKIPAPVATPVKKKRGLLRTFFGGLRTLFFGKKKS